MRRLLYLLLLVLFVSASATCVNASTDCERWFVAYRHELAHSRNVQRIAAAKRRAKLYARRKISQVQTKPKPKVILARAPRMTRKETLRHFDLACGVLPEDDVDNQVISEETPPPFIEHPLNDSVDLLPVDLNDMIADGDVPPPPFDFSSTYYPSSGGPPVYLPPFTGGLTPGTPGPGTPGLTNLPGTPTPPNTPVTPDVPEPATYIFMLTGLVGAAGAFRRRVKA